MLTTLRTFARAAAGLALAAGCLLGAGDASAQQRAPAASNRPIDITVQNQARAALSYLYVALPNAIEWGENRVGDESVAPRARFQFRLESGPCLRDLRAVYESGTEETRFNVDLCMARRQTFSGAASMPLPQRAGPNLLFRIRNAGQEPATALYALPSGHNTSGDNDLLDTGALPPGSVVTGRTARWTCRFDIIAAYGESAERQERQEGVDLCATPEVTLAGPSAAPALAAAPQQAHVQVTIANRTSEVLAVLHVRPAGTEDWGPDRLGADVVNAGASYAITVEAGPTCLFDVQAYFGSGRNEVRERVDLCAEPNLAYADIPFDPATMLEVNVVNGGSATLFILNLRPAGGQDWGQDRFGSDVVAAGGTYRVRLMRSDGCAYDVRLIYEDRREEVRSGVDLCAEPTLTFTGPAETPSDPATTLEVGVANGGTDTLFSLYLRPAGAQDWGPDRFGSDVVAAGATYRVRLGRDAGCVYDVRLVYEDRREELREGVNLCEQPSLTFAGAPGGGQQAPAGDLFEVTVSNTSGATLYALFMRAEGATGWSRDLLGRDILESGQSYTVRVNRRNGCRFEARLVFTDRTERLLPARDLCAEPRLAVEAPDPAQMVAVTIENRSPQVLFALFLRPAGTNDWGQDRFGSDVVPVGESYRVTIDRGNGCSYDVRLVYNDRSEEVREGVDLCATPTLAFTRAERSGQRDPQGTFDVTVTNRSGTTLYALFLRPQGAEQWSRDMLGSSVVENGRDFRLRVNRRAGCVFETRLVFTDQSERALPARDLCAEPVIAVTAPDPSQMLQVSVVNRSQQVLYAMFVRRAGTSEWGPDRFGANVVPVGQSFRVRLDRGQGCDYDVRLVYNDRSEEVRERQNLCANPELAYTGPAANARGRGRIKEETESQEAPPQISEVTIINRSTMPIESFHASSARVSEWLADRLTGEPIIPGAERTFQIERDGQCLFDMRVTYAGGREERRMRVDICATTRFTFMGPDERLVDGGGPAEGRLVTIVNTGPIELRELFMTSVEDTHWGDDRLGANTLPRRWRMELRLPTADGCRYDVRAVFRSGAAVERRNVDVCAEPTIRFEQRHAPGSLVATGTGFYVSAQGHILTNQHVVDGCSVVALYRPGLPPITLRRIAEDERGDLALLQQEGATPTPLAFRPATQPIRAGERVVVIGYPVRQELGGVNVAEGLLSALRGQRGDARRFQYSAPTQPGNSGGPVFDENGQVIGVVVSQLAGLGEDRSAQNINFGIALDEVRRFLEANGVSPASAGVVQPQRPADLLERAGPSVVPLDCLG